VRGIAVLLVVAFHCRPVLSGSGPTNISARQYDSLDLRAAYRSLRESLAPAGFTAWNTPIVMILPMSDPFIKDLRKLYGKYREIEGTRIGNQMIGGRFVEDAFVYRIS